ncbi:EamA family transporter RarD [Ruegeria sp. 2205SS24-7]|uniref:EamA family transporter RarD n=1 Tax=Ruegeria discodermiae TaxID=3064389 RepID=UPI00274088AF|nr:EamA family transporter RarD [Ruegeria sp. 2205SS24-7]MDP5216663.1 EamA family transporter RarD [Ruegeria sp. 2205SS24-7]
MTETTKGIAAMIAACTVWGLSPLFYKQLEMVPPLELLSHRAVWSIVFFAAVLALQGRLREIPAAYSGGQTVKLLLAGLMISLNWLVFLVSVQIGKVADAALGYYIFPLCAVLAGRFWFGERLARPQWAAIGLAALSVLVLSFGTGVPPWIALLIGAAFALYGAIKKGLQQGPVLSVTCEILILLPLWLAVLVQAGWVGKGLFGSDVLISTLLVLSGPMTAVPLILFSYAAQRVQMSTMGVLQYINPSLQFICAVVVFGEPFSFWHVVAFSLIWLAVLVFSLNPLIGGRQRGSRG